MAGFLIQSYRAAFACSHRAVNAAGSWIAVSESILRFMSMPASFRPVSYTHLDVIFVEKLDVEAGETVKFDRVLAVIDEDKAVFGTPVVENAVVSGNVVKNGKSKKIRVYKMKPKKGYRRTQGHRQPYTKVEITKIEA